jgi:7-cyano-7-deazaguanine synthase
MEVYMIKLNSDHKIVILVSGGVDSTTLLHELHKNGNDLLALSFNYGSRHNERELECAVYQCQQLNVPHTILFLTFMKQYFKSALLQGDEEIPHGHYTDINQKKTVVPFRNGIMLSVAAGIADSHDYSIVALASHSGDHAIYPDCRVTFNSGMRQAILRGTYNEVVLLTPYERLNKRDIVRRGIELGVDYTHTWSCYEGGEAPCGKCGACIERAEAMI